MIEVLVVPNVKGAVIRAVACPVALTWVMLLTWSLLVMATAFRLRVNANLENCTHQVGNKSKGFLAQRGGADIETNSDELATGLLQYLTSVFHGAHPQSSMSLRNSRELRTRAECIDVLLAGDLPHLGDLLMQRLKAVQTAVVEGNSNFAQHMELIPATGSNVVTHD